MHGYITLMVKILIFPHNLGYKIGDFLVGEYCKSHKIKPIEAVRIPTMEFIKFAKKEILKCEK